MYLFIKLTLNEEDNSKFTKLKTSRQIKIRPIKKVKLKIIK